MARTSGHVTDRGQLWVAQLEAAQQRVEEAERLRDDLVKDALADGLGVRGVARALGIDKGTVSRRYGQGASQ